MNSDTKSIMLIAIAATLLSSVSSVVVHATLGTIATVSD